MFSTFVSINMQILVKNFDVVKKILREKCFSLKYEIFFVKLEFLDEYMNCLLMKNKIGMKNKIV
jgi:hypothetical protein